MRKHNESNLQSLCVKWFRIQFPDLRKRLLAIPNAGKRSVVMGAMMKREGLLPGSPDLFLAMPVQPFGGLFIEMKTEKGRLTDTQKEMIEELKSHYKTEVCHSFEEFQQAINNYLHPKK